MTEFDNLVKTKYLPEDSDCDVYVSKVVKTMVTVERKWYLERTLECHTPEFFKTKTERIDLSKDSPKDNIKEEKFVQWTKSQPLTQNDLLYASNNVQEDDMDYMKKENSFPPSKNRVYFNFFKPTCKACYDDKSPLFVVLNAGPISVDQSTQFCSFLGTYFHCLSFDCLSRGYNPSKFGDKDYLEEEQKRMTIANYEYRSIEYAQQVCAMIHCILYHLVKMTGNIQDIKKKDIVIISTLYTTNMATVIAGSTKLRKYGNNVSCFYMSNAILPFKKNDEYLEKMVDEFCGNTSNIPDIPQQTLNTSLKRYLSALVVTNSKTKNNLPFFVPNSKSGQLDVIDVETKVENSELEKELSLIESDEKTVSRIENIFEMSKVISNSVNYVSANGAPEKMCYMVQLCKSMDVFEQTFLDIKLQHTDLLQLADSYVNILARLNSKNGTDETHETMKTDVDPGYKKATFISFDVNPPNYVVDKNLQYSYFMDFIAFVPVNLGFLEMNTRPLTTVMTLLQYLDKSNETSHLAHFISSTSYSVKPGFSSTNHVHKY